MHSEQDPDKCGNVLRRVRGAERSSSESRKGSGNWLREVRKAVFPPSKDRYKKERTTSVYMKRKRQSV